MVTTLTLTVILTSLLAAAAPAVGQTVYDPSPDDPRIKAVLDARQRAADAAARQDWKTVESLFAPEVVVNSPTNRVVRLDDVVARFRSGQIAAESGTNDSRIEFVGVIGVLYFSPAPSCMPSGRSVATSRALH